MQTIGLIGGLSWESSLEYYRIINQTVKEKLGGLHSAQCIMYSVDFEPIEKLLHVGDWLRITDILIDVSKKLHKGGADFIVICCNTMHKTADVVQEAVGIPVLHIADATAEHIKSKGMKKIGLLGTKFVMEGDFYQNKLSNNHGIEVIVPDAPEREIVNNVIFTELCLGILKQSSRDKIKEIIARLALCGAEGIVLGCTEIPLLIKQEDSSLPIFDTMTIHATTAVDCALK